VLGKPGALPVALFVIDSRSVVMLCIASSFGNSRATAFSKFARSSPDSTPLIAFLIFSGVYGNLALVSQDSLHDSAAELTVPPPGSMIIIEIVTTQRTIVWIFFGILDIFPKYFLL